MVFKPVVLVAMVTLPISLVLRGDVRAESAPDELSDISEAVAIFPANSQYWHFTVPAAGCIPPNPTEAAKVSLTNGSWALSGTNLGPATVVCSIPATFWYWDLNLSAGAYIGPYSLEIQDFQLSKRDPDGLTSGTDVTAVLKRRVFGGSASTMATLSSSSSSSTADSFVAVDVNGTAFTQATYFAEVTLKRSTTAHSVAFHGIGFGP